MKTKQRRAIEKAISQTMEKNRTALECASFDGVTWEFQLHGQSRSWFKIAKAQVEALAEREGISSESIDVLIRLPEHGRTFRKFAGSHSIVAYG